MEWRHLEERSFIKHNKVVERSFLSCSEALLQTSVSGHCAQVPHIYMTMTHY